MIQREDLGSSLFSPRVLLSESPHIAELLAVPRIPSLRWASNARANLLLRRAASGLRPKLGRAMTPWPVGTPLHW